MKGEKIVSGIMLSVVIVGIFGSVFNPKPALSSEVYSQEKAPDFTLTDIYGETFCLYDCSAKVVLIEFFGTWCSPCVQQIPALRNIYENYSRDQLEMISISSEDEGVLRNFTREHGIEWIVARDTAGVMNDYGVQYIPTIFLVDAQHYIRYKHVGLTGESTLRSEIESLLPKTIYVDDDNTAGPWDGTQEHPYQNITSGIEHASAGDTIYVYNGTYYENVVVNKTVSLIGEDKSATIIDGSGKGTVVYVTANSVTISGLTIRNGGFGKEGIVLSYSNHSTIYNNVIVHAPQLGISLKYSDYNTITGNIVANNSYGIYLDNSDYNFFENNTIESNGALGLTLSHSDTNAISVNTITSNGMDGIWLYHSSFNTILGNTISKSLYGIDLAYSNGNSIYHNNIINNTHQVHIPYSAPNIWDDGYPSGGNYWSDYPGVDVKSGPGQDKPGSDGIGDTPYTIDANNRDNYPFMNSWGAPPPPLYALSIFSSPTGVTFTVDGVSRTTPWSGTYYEGASVSPVMPETHTAGDAKYYWNQWSDGVTSRSRTVTMNTNITLTAYFTGPYYELTVTSLPITGVTFTINEVLETTPYTEWLLEGSYTLEMPETHNGYVWSHWLEDGDTSRTKTITLPGTTWTAVYTPAPPPPAVGGEMTLIKAEKPPPLLQDVYAWISVISAIMSTTASVVYLKHRKKKQA